MPSQTLAFFGATGDASGFCLAAALKHGYDCIALARTPEKLSSSMTAKGVSQETQDQYLTIIKGDVRDIATVKQTLVLKGRVVDTIVSGVGCTSVKLVWNPIFPFALTDDTICQDASRTVFAALKSLAPVQKPLLINISTTGIPPPGKPRDIPILWIPFYIWMLHSPHLDKRVMETNVRKELEVPERDRPIRACVTVRPSFFAGASKGWEKLIVGTDDKPVRGFFTERQDVGEFIFEKLVKQDVPVEWLNNGVHLTH